jgi:16S rRNA (guanine966-N2)-methyltransferase
MRVLEGKYRRRPLRSVASIRVRPTTRRLREALFDLLATRTEGARFLDLCAGSGAVGIEALSRGAAHVTFVDRSRKMCGLVEANLDLCGVPEDETEVVLSEAAEFLRRTISHKGAAWDIAFFDPPYALDYSPVLNAFGSGSLLQPAGVLIVEHHHKHELKEATGNIRRWRIIKQGDSCLSFYECQ